MNLPVMTLHGEGKYSDADVHKQFKEIKRSSIIKGNRHGTVTAWIIIE